MVGQSHVLLVPVLSELAALSHELGGLGADWLRVGGSAATGQPQPLNERAVSLGAAEWGLEHTHSCMLLMSQALYEQVGARVLMSQALTSPLCLTPITVVQSVTP